MGRATPSDPLKHLYALWWNGVGLGQAIRHVRNATGADIGFEQARRHFARWADEFMGRAA